MNPDGCREIFHRKNPRAYIRAIVLAFTLFSSFNYAAAKKGKVAESVVALTDAVKALEAKCSAMQAIQAEEGLSKEADATAKAVAKLQGAADKLRQMEENQKLAPKTLEDAKNELQRAKAKGEEDPENEKKSWHYGLER